MNASCTICVAVAASAIIAATTVAVPAIAADDPAVLRQDMMKSVGAATGMSAAMVKGEAPFDARVAHLALRVMNASANGFGALFPEGSETGAETEAKAEIWSDRAGFDAAVAKFRDDTAAVLAPPPADLDAFKAAFGQVTQNCGSCHEKYRVKK